MTDSQQGQSEMPNNNGGMAVSISSEIMVAAVIFLFMVIVFVLFLYLYAKHYWGANPAAFRRSRANFVFVPDQSAPLPRRGLDPTILRSLPITIYNKEDFKEQGLLECSVCLSELADGEQARLLPKCSHGFHLECIDMWFHSHSTCPLCRCSVGPPPSQDSAASGNTQSVVISEIPPLPRDGYLTESSPNFSFPTNVLFWGTHDRISTGGSTEGTSSSSGSSSGKPQLQGMLVIDIPRRGAEGFAIASPNSPLPSSRNPPMEEMKSPTSARLRSLRRLLSRGKRGIGSSFSPREGDIEQGVVGVGAAAAASAEGSVLVPKTPSN